MTKKDRIETEKKLKAYDREWYSIRSLIGNSWAMLYYLLGGREAGKSYAVTKFYVNQFYKYGRPFFWLRLTEASARKLLQNNAEKLVDPDIRRHYKLELETRGDAVYALRRDANGEVIEKKLMARVLALSTFYNDKGSGLFDNEFLNDPKMYYNVCLDEMNREVGSEKRTFDITYAFANQIENLVRSTKNRLRIILIGNTLEEASDLLAAINFLPEEFGRYKLKSKRAIVDYIEPSAKYLERRKGSVASIISGESSTFTNKVEVDTTLITGKRLIKPSYVIKFSKTEKYTVWDSNVVAPYNGEQVQVVAMRPYIDELFNVQQRDSIIVMYDTRTLLFRNLITQKRFKKALEYLKPRK